jgi:hypothetical protein
LQAKLKAGNGNGNGNGHGKPTGNSRTPEKSVTAKRGTTARPPSVKRGER